MAFVDVQLIEGLALPYVPGAESALADPWLDPVFNAAWQTLAAGFPGLSLQPLFDSLTADELADIVDAVRLAGAEPPNPFVWFTLPCDDASVNDLVAALQPLSMVVYAGRRPDLALAASYGTNPDTNNTLQIQPSPNGIDAIYLWDIPGGAGEGARLIDIEIGWMLEHEELIPARIRKLSVFGTGQVDHGTACAGIIVGADNGLGTIGIAPEASLDLVTHDRGNGFPNLAAAIVFATASLESGDVLLLEAAQGFTPDVRPDILVEFDPAVQAAIRLAVLRGITVIEPAGNGGIDLDAFPFLAHTRPGSPSFSGAVVVGAGELTGPTLSTWSRTFSTFGSRVDCFAAGSRIRAPAASAFNAYQQFGGTSGASAILAGAAASLQAMTRAATGSSLAPADIRRLFSSALLGVLPDDPFGARIGSMPDMRKIAQAQGLRRILPVAAAKIAGDALFMVHLDEENRIVRRHFTFFTGWGIPLAAGPPNDTFQLTASQPAVWSAEETTPVPRLRHDAFITGPGGIHHLWWDSNGQVGDVSASIASVTVAAQGRALAVAQPLPDRLLLAGINPQGRLIALTGDPQVLLSGLAGPVVIDPVGSYRRVAGPALATRGGGSADIVAIEDGGSLNWYTGNLLATIGTGWTGPVTEPDGVQFDPGARPALLVLNDRLLAAAVGSEGWLRVVEIDPAAGTVAAPVVVDVQAVIDASGPVALALAGANVVVLGVDPDCIVRAATLPAAGGAWTPLLPLLSTGPISPLGGVVAVSIDLGIMAIAVGVDGVAHSALSVNGLLWSPLAPLP